MRTYTATSLLLPILLFFSQLQGQNILFEEDFESTPITTVENELDDTLWTGSSWCVQAARGMTSHHNSSNVDFKSSENGSYFLANNPEDSCGGANTATVVSDSSDFSGVDSIFFSTRYFMGDSIGWGAQTLRFDIMTSNDTTTLDTVFSDTSTWASVDMRISDNMIDDTVWFSIKLGGGEAVAVDDIMIYAPATTDLNKMQQQKTQKKELQAYPNPFKGRFRVKNPYPDAGELMVRFIDVEGRTVKKLRKKAQKELQFDGSGLQEGIYFLEIAAGKKRSLKRMVRQ